MSDLTPEENALRERVFKEFTEILTKHNITADQANWLTILFPSRWHYLPLESLKLLQDLLRTIPLSTYFKKEAEIKKLLNKAALDLIDLVTD